MRVLHSYERYLARMRAQSVKAGRAVKFAYRQVGKPYQWGGAGPRTYDCSGLVMAAWRKGGLRLPHRADLQHHTIRRKVSLKHLRPGDLVFFSGDHHVGIYVGRRHFLHAPHTGARVQRGTLSGWRLRTFAGAARPGAPAYHPWPHWVRTLAGHGDEHGHEHARHHHGHAAAPDAIRPGDAPLVAPISPDFDAGDQDSDVYPPQPPVETPPAVQPEQPPTGPQAEQPLTGPRAGQPLTGPQVDQPPTGPRAEPASPPAPAYSSPAYSPRAQAPVAHSRGAHAPVARAQGEHAPVAHARAGLALPLLTMSAHRGRHHAVRADSAPVPPPADQGSTRPEPHWPESSVQKQNDEQVYNRDFDGHGGGDDGDDGDNGLDGIDLKSILGAP